MIEDRRNEPRREMRVWKQCLASALVFLLGSCPVATLAGSRSDTTDDPLLPIEKDEKEGSAHEQIEPKPSSRELFPGNAWTVFIGVQAGRRSMGGEDFNGGLVLRHYDSNSGVDEEALVPRIEPAFCYGLAVGARSGSWGVGIGYAQAFHDWSWRGEQMAPSQVTSRTAHLDVHAHVFSSRRIQPFLFLGFLYSGIKVQDGRTDIASNVSSDMTFKGWGLNWGAGVAVYPTSELTFTAGARRHYGFYDKVSGLALDRSLVCTGVDFYFSASMRVGAQSLGR